MTVIGVPQAIPISAPASVAVPGVPVSSITATSVPQVTEYSRINTGTGGRQGFTGYSGGGNRQQAPNVTQAAILNSAETPQKIQFRMFSPFFAQVIAQESSAAPQALLQAYEEEFAPKLGDYDTMLSFSKVKYMPSNAFAPREPVGGALAKAPQQTQQQTIPPQVATVANALSLGVFEDVPGNVTNFATPINLPLQTSALHPEFNSKLYVRADLPKQVVDGAPSLPTYSKASRSYGKTSEYGERRFSFQPVRFSL